MASDEAPLAPTSQPIIPRRFALGNPFPNPFNGRVQVRISMPQADRLKLVLYDLTGRTALMGYDAVLSEGNHLLSLNAATLPTGLYLLQAETGGLRVHRKVMLIK
jgi:hypothetical protein